MRCVGQAIIGHLPPLHIVPPGSAYICSRVFFGLYFNTHCVYQPFKKPLFVLLLLLLLFCIFKYLSGNQHCTRQRVHNGNQDKHSSCLYIIEDLE